jgi:RND family efflux transporter MFP subunit
VSSRLLNRKVLLWAVLGVVVGASVGAYLFLRSSHVRNKLRRARSQTVRVDVVRPQRTGLTRYSEQPCSVHAYEHVDLAAGVSGFLDKLTVDYGSKVKKGQLLARVAVPIEEAQVRKEEASLLYARSQVEVAHARKSAAAADLRVAEATIFKAKASWEIAKHMRAYRKQQFDRVSKLTAGGGYVQELADEKQEQYAAAQETEEAAKENMTVVKGQRDAAYAKYRQSVAELANAEANVKVVKAEVEKAKVLVQFADIPAPFPGVITYRAVFPPAYIRSAREGGQALLKIARTDKVRLVLQVPDRDVPYANEGDPARVEIFAVPKGKFKAPDGGEPRISLTSGAEDPVTRTMRVEVALDNKDGKLTPGMPGQVKLTLYHNPRALTIPSTCLRDNPAGKKAEAEKAPPAPSRDTGHAWVFVVRGDKAVITPIRTGADDGVRVEVLEGLTEQDLVVEGYSGTLVNGAPVRVGQER